MTSERLRIARRNTAFLMVVLYLSDIFWYCLSRSGFITDRAYRVSDFEWHYFTLFVVLSVLFAVASVAFSFYVRPLPRIRVSNKIVPILVICAIGLNIFSMLVVDPAARYRGGSFTPFSWAVYVLSNALSLAVVMLVIRENSTGKKVPLKWVLGLLASYAITIDGMASALTLFMFVFLIFGFGHISFRRILLGAFFAVGLFFVGLNAKFEETPEYFTQDFMLQWVSARFSIQAEQAYTYISENSIVGNDIAYWDLVIKATSDRFDLVMGNNVIEEKPRNVSEAMHYDMHGAYLGSGSSPGILANTVIQGWGFWIVPLFFCFFFIQHFYSVGKLLNFIEVVAYAFCFKVFHANFSSVFSIVTPPVISMLLFLSFCFICSNKDIKIQ